MPTDLRTLVADPDFLGLPADRQRALAVEADPELGSMDIYGQDRLLTQLAPDPYIFTERRWNLPAGLTRSMEELESSGGKNQLSPTGVRGPMQITGRTGKAFGLDDAPSWNDPRDQLSTSGHILADNLRTTKGDIRAAVNLYAAEKDRGWYADRVLANLGKYAGTPGAVEVPRSLVAGTPAPEEGATQPAFEEPATTTTPTTGESLPHALGNAAIDTGHHVAKSVDQLGASIGRAVQDPGPRTIGRAAWDTLPLISPTVIAGETLGDVAARTKVGGLDVSPETGRTIGGVGTGVAMLAPGALRGAARLLSPTMMARVGAADTKVAAEAANAAVQSGNDARLLARPAAGEAAQTTAGDISTRLFGEARSADEAALAAQPNALSLQPTEAVPAGTRVATDAEARAGALYRVPTPAEPARSLTRANFDGEFLELRQVHERAADAAARFDTVVSKKLSGLGPHATTLRLAKDPDLTAAILAHATPAEAAIVQRAIEAGKPLGKLPYSDTELAKIGADVAAGRSVLSPLVNTALGGAGLAYFTGYQTQALGGAAMVVLGRIALKAFDAALGTRPGQEAFRALGRVQVGTPAAVRIATALGRELFDAPARSPQRYPAGADLGR